MLPAQHHIAFLFPALVEIAETAVVVAVRVCSPVLLPQQLPGSVLVLLQLFVNVREVGQRALACWLTAISALSP
jgi:hypothetical protein